MTLPKSAPDRCGRRRFAGDPRGERRRDPAHLLPDLPAGLARVRQRRRRQGQQAHSGQRTVVLADCKALETGFTTAQTTMTTARATIAAGIAADRSLITASCPAPTTPQTQPVCTRTTSTEKTAIKVLRSQQLAVIHTYFVTINANRHTFWTAVKALPGEAHVKADTPLPVPPA